MRIPQSAAILRFAGRLSGIYPEDAVTALRCDAVIDAVQDFNEKMRPSMGQFLPDLDDAARVTMRRELATTVLPLWLERVAAELDDDGPFALGGHLYVCDLPLYVRLKWLRMGILDGIPPDLVDANPRLIEFMDAVKKEPRVAAFYDNESKVRKYM